MLPDFDYAELLKYKTPHAPKADERERLDTLTQRGLVRIYDFEQVDIGPYGKVPAPNRYVLTVAGKDALSEFEKVRDQQAEDKRQRRFQNKVSVLSALVPLATFFLGLVVEHYAGIIAWISEHG